MNWALLRGEKSFGISIVEVNEGIDTGAVLADHVFSIGENDTIADLQSRTNAMFPNLLVRVMRSFEFGTVRRRVQGEKNARYFPLRFPEDGLVLWDRLDAHEVHNRVRALTDPYPNAFTFLDNRRVRIRRTEIRSPSYFGEPGRVYSNTGQAILVCARDRCLWITDAVFSDDPNRPIWGAVKKYSMFATLHGMFLERQFFILETGVL